MSVWDDILAAAVVGTDRQPAPEASSETPLGALLGRLDRAEPERALLGAAAAVALHRRAGRLPGRDAARDVAPCEPERLPACSARAGQHLALALGGEYGGALAEWLAAAAAAGLRVPEEQLPPLLDLCAAQPALGPLAEPVLGERGRWLAAQNPAWRAVARDPDPAAWETGSRAERLALLRAFRAADPPRALEMLAGSWPQEEPADRAAFVAALETGLGPADEPFLESALDDRRKEVRRAAAELLSRLPGSGLCRRMEERAAALVRFTREGAPRGGRVEVELPESCDRAMARDGVDPSRRSGRGERASTLEQLIAAVPPSRWSALWGAGPGELLTTADLGEWRDLLVDAWGAAAVRFVDAEWAEAVARARIGSSGGRAVGPALALLPPDRLERLARELLGAERGPLSASRAALEVLRACRHVWSRELTAAFLERYAPGLEGAGGEPGAPAVRYLLRDFARSFSVELGGEVAEAVASDAASGAIPAELAAEIVAIVEFRRDMLEELQGSRR